MPAKLGIADSRPRFLTNKKLAGPGIGIQRAIVF